MSKNWYVYIAKSADNYYYTGISPDPKERIKKHNDGKGAQMAKERGPFTLMYKSKAYRNKSLARKREVQVKGWRREKKEKLINGEWV